MVTVKVVIALVALVTAAVFMTSGLLIGHFAIKQGQPCSSTSTTLLDVKPLIIKEITASQIGSYLRTLTSVPHVAGTKQDKEQAEWVRDKLIEAGLDHVKTVPYRVLLSYPSAEKGVVNEVSLLDERGQVRFATVGKQPALGAPEESSDEVLPNYNAYSAGGVVQGNLVYAYYGRVEDFEYLVSRGVKVSGRIALIRFGTNYRGSKVQIAQRYGAKGVILFSDPRDKAAQGRNFTFPRSWWMPGMGVEFGTLFGGEGDPLTPFYPSIEGAYRIKEQDQPFLPRIPVQSIGYDEAEILLRHMSQDNPAPDGWVGHLDAPYNLGPGLRYPGWTVKMNISTRNEQRTIYNTIGILRGSVEDDRYVLLGNHRDSWIFGSLDPSSGTASFLELIRALGKIKKDKNWRPRRTIIFCSWGGEEFGLIGSYEWVEQHAKALGQRAVAYLNVDTAVEGNKTLFGNAFPTLKQLLIDSSKLVPNPNPAEVAAGRPTVFHTWLANNPDPSNSSQPNVGNIRRIRDYKAFSYVVGIPSTDIGYTAPSAYPLYHTLYDNFLLASEIMDKGFVHHQAVARLWALVAIELADATILPLDIRAYAASLKQSFQNLETKYGAQLERNNVSLLYFAESVEHFDASVGRFLKELDKVDGTNPMAVRRINDKLMYLERYFVDPRGLPGRPNTNHIVFSSSLNDSYATDTFAGLTDLLLKVGNKTAEQDPETWAQIQQHLAVIAFMIDEAGRSLNINEDLLA